MAVASVADNVSDGYRTVRDPLAAAPGSEVLVVGGFARSISLYAVASAFALGSPRVVFADTDEGRLERAAALGAETIPVTAGEDGEPEWPRTFGRFPITVDASGSHGGLHAAIRSAAANGTVTSVAIYFEPETPVPLLEMYTRGCTFHTERCHARALIPEVLEAITAGTARPVAGDQRGGELRRRSRRARRSAHQARHDRLNRDDGYCRPAMTAPEAETTTMLLATGRDAPGERRARRDREGPGERRPQQRRHARRGSTRAAAGNAWAWPPRRSCGSAAVATSRTRLSLTSLEILHSRVSRSLRPPW